MRMNSITDPTMFGGMWKFDSSIERTTVLNAARGLKAAGGVQYLEMYIRAWSGTDRFAICFRAIGHQRQYVSKVMGEFRRLFGHDEQGRPRVTCDISGPITTLL